MRHILNHPDCLNLRRLISFLLHRPTDSKAQVKGRMMNQRNKEVPEKENKEMSGKSTKDKSNKIGKFLISPQVDRARYLIRRNQVFLIYSYLQEQPKKTIKCVWNVVKMDIGNVIVELQHGANSVCPKHMQHKPAGGMQILLGITQLHPVGGQLQYRTRKKLRQLGQVHRQDTNRR